MSKYLVTEFTVIEADDIEEAKALVAELEGDVMAVEADPVDEAGVVVGFAALHRMERLTKGGLVVMTPEDIRTHVEESLEGDGEYSPYHGLDVDEIVSEALDTTPWIKGFATEAMMDPAWMIVEMAASEAAKNIKRAQDGD